MATNEVLVRSFQEVIGVIEPQTKFCSETVSFETREGLEKTPERAAKALQFLTSGYKADLDKIVNNAIFNVDGYGDEMVVVKDIEFYSLCEHHILPFYGYAHVAYIPKGKVIGLSKIPRIVDMFARRLQIQEQLTTQIADTLVEILKPKGVGVVIEGQHFCMCMRGVQKQNARMKTSALKGSFFKKSKTRKEFFDLIR